MTRRHFGAFTLIELLVVISLISLLVSILLPALQSARKSAWQIQCASQLRQIGMLVEYYCNDDKGRYPRTYDPNNASMNLGWVSSGKAPSWGPTWAEYMASVYLNRSKKLFICTDRPFTGTPAGYYVDFGLNQYLSSGGTTGWTRHGDIARPSDIIVSMDTCNSYANPTSGYYVFGDWSRAHLRHAQGANLVYADGHVNYLKMKQDSVSCNTYGHPLYGATHIHK